MRTADDVGVAILGGGAAGCATAIELARAGVATVVLQRGQPGWRVGETLPPAAAPELRALGVWDRFLAAGHLPVAGNRSVWGGPEPAERDFIFDPYGPGWHLDRPRFDAMMAEAAVDAGARWVACPAPVPAPRRAAGGWEVAPAGIHARFVIDATGRAATVGRAHGAHRLVVDRMIGVVALVRGRAGDPRTLVEAGPSGWWYSAATPAGTAVAYMTDADLLDARHACTPAGWSALVADDPSNPSPLNGCSTGDRLDGRGVVGEPVAGPRVVAAGSSVLRPAAGEGWAAVGDAAATCDPLASQGILAALTSGRAAARAVLAELDGAHGHGGALRRYAASVAAGYVRYLALRAGYYAVERRWPDAPFWQRRHRGAARTLAGSSQGGSP